MALRAMYMEKYPKNEDENKKDENQTWEYKKQGWFEFLNINLKELIDDTVTFFMYLLTVIAVQQN